MRPLLLIFFFRGFLKGDKALGQIQVKLNSFDNKCEIHDCLDVSNILLVSCVAP